MWWKLRKLFFGLFLLSCSWLWGQSGESSDQSELSDSDSLTRSERIAQAIANANEALLELEQNSIDSEAELRKVYDSLSLAREELLTVSNELLESEASRKEIASLLEKSDEALKKLDKQRWALIAYSALVSAGLVLALILGAGK